MLPNSATVRRRKRKRIVMAGALYLAHIAMIILALLLIEERWVVGRVPA